MVRWSDSDKDGPEEDVVDDMVPDVDDSVPVADDSVPVTGEPGEAGRWRFWFWW